jgi:hypothetical protein
LIHFDDSGLHRLNEPGDRHRPRESAKNVQMVRDHAQTERRAFNSLKRPDKIRLKLAPQRDVPQKRLAILGAVDIRQRLRQAIVPVMANERGAGGLPGSSYLEPQRGEIL